ANTCPAPPAAAKTPYLGPLLLPCARAYTPVVVPAPFPNALPKTPVAAPFPPLEACPDRATLPRPAVGLHCAVNRPAYAGPVSEVAFTEMPVAALLPVAAEAI